MVYLPGFYSPVIIHVFKNEKNAVIHTVPLPTMWISEILLCYFVMKLILFIEYKLSKLQSTLFSDRVFPAVNPLQQTDYTSRAQKNCCCQQLYQNLSDTELNYEANNTHWDSIPQQDWTLHLYSFCQTVSQESLGPKSDKVKYEREKDKDRGVLEWCLCSFELNNVLTRWETFLSTSDNS